MRESTRPRFVCLLLLPPLCPNFFGPLPPVEERIERFLFLSFGCNIRRFGTSIAMAAKPLTTEAIALTEKKMEMALDDIIKMSKKNGGKGKKAPRVSNKSQAFRNGGRSQGNSYKVQNFLDSRSSIRQGVLAKRRSNAPGNQFPFTTEVARRAINAPINKRGFNSYKPRAAPVLMKVPVIKAAEREKPLPRQRQTLDARFANINEQKMKVVVPQQVARGGFNMNASRRRGQQQRRQQQQRRANGVVGAPSRPFGNYPKY